VEQETSLKHGNVYLLAGGSDYQLKKKYNKMYLTPISDSSSEYHPSFNTLVKSTLMLEERSLIIILSGLGNDGSLCLKEVREKGMLVAVQDPATAVAPFMPRAAIMSGQVDDVITEEQLPDYLKKRVA
jgi:two-component system chemotaxis response regulator CheB